MSQPMPAVQDTPMAPSAQFAQLLGELIMRGMAVGVAVSALLLGFSLL